jgi:hypothetical protein
VHLLTVIDQLNYCVPGQANRFDNPSGYRDGRGIGKDCRDLGFTVNHEIT